MKKKFMENYPSWNIFLNLSSTHSMILNDFLNKNTRSKMAS